MGHALGGAGLLLPAGCLHCRAADFAQRVQSGGVGLLLMLPAFTCPACQVMTPPA